MGQNVGEVDIKVQLDKASLSSSLRSAKGDVDSWASDVESRTSKLGSKIGGLAKTGLLAAGAAAVGIGTAGLSSYRDLEEAASQAAAKSVDVYGKSSDEIGAEYDKLLKHVQDVSADVGASTVFSDIEVAKTFNALAAGGIDISNVGRTQLLPFMNLASSTGEELTDVTDLLTGSMASFGYGMEDSSKIADQLAMAMNGSKASMSTLNYALRQGGSTASATGMELSEFSAIVGVLADRNYTGEQSGAALKTAMLSLYNPTKVQMAALEKLGITYDQVDPRVNDFRDTLKLLISQGAEIGDFGQIFTDSSGAIMFSLAGAGDSVDALKEKIVGSQGLSQTVSDLMMDSNRLVGAWEEAKGATMGMVTAIGGYLEPAAVKLLNTWKNMIPALREFGSALAEGDWSKVGQMLGNAWTVAKEKGMEFLSWAGTALQSIDWGTAATQAGGIIAGGIKTGLNVLSSLGATIAGWIRNFDYSGAGSTIAGWIRSGFNYLSDIGSQIYDYIINFDYASAGSTIAGWLKEGFEYLSDIGSSIYNWIVDFDYQSAGSRIGGWIEDGLDVLQNVGKTIAGWIETSGGWEGVGKSLGGKVASGIAAITTYADGIKNKLQDWISSGGPASLGSDIGNKIATAVKDLMDLGKWIADSLTEKGGGSLIQGAIQTAVEWVSLGASAVSQFVSGFIEGLSPLGASIYNTIIDAVSGALGMLPYGVGEGLADTLQSSKMEVDWSKKTYNPSTKKWSTTSAAPTTVTGTGGQTLPADMTKTIGGGRGSSGALDAIWQNGKLMVSKGGIGSGEGWMTAEDWAKKAGAAGYSEKDIQKEIDLLRSSKVPIGGSMEQELLAIARDAGNIQTTAARDSGNTTRQAARDSSAITTTGAQDHARAVTTATEYYRASQSEIISRQMAASALINSEWRVSADVLNSRMTTGSSAILESAAATKINFDLGSKAWVEGVASSNLNWTAATRANAAVMDTTTQTYAATHLTAMANFQATNLMVSNETRAASTVANSNMRSGGSAILESANAAKMNFDLGGKNWINSTNQGGAIHINAANQGAAVTINASNQKASIETSTANNNASVTTTASMGLKANVEGSGENFKSSVTAASSAASSAISGLGSVLASALGGRLSFSGGGGGGSVGSANFTDCLFEGGFVDGCTGVSIPGLKYTNPGGVTTVINPMNYLSGGGVSNYISGGSSGRSGGYSLPAAFRARGGLIEKPEVALIGEKGSEMVLPHDITQTIQTLTNMGLDKAELGKSNPVDGDITINVNLDGRQITHAVMSRATGMMKQAGFGIR